MKRSLAAASKKCDLTIASEICTFCKEAQLHCNRQYPCNHCKEMNTECSNIATKKVVAPIGVSQKLKKGKSFSKQEELNREIFDRKSKRQKLNESPNEEAECKENICVSLDTLSKVATMFRDERNICIESIFRTEDTKHASPSPRSNPTELPSYCNSIVEWDLESHIQDCKPQQQQFRYNPESSAFKRVVK